MTSFFAMFQPVLRRTWLLLGLILLLGLVIRLGLISQKGYEFDIRTIQGWGKTAALTSLADSYQKQLDGTMIPNYPPFSLLIFGTAARVDQVFSPSIELGTGLYHAIIKLPAIFTDLLAAFLSFFIVGFAFGRKQGLLAALLFAVHPVVWYSSAVWGQTDVIFTLCITVALFCWVLRMPYFLGFFAMLAILTKFQAILLFPLLALLLCIDKRPLKGILHAAGGGLTAAAFVLWPFLWHGTIVDVYQVFHKSVGGTATLSVNAYNFWWSLFSDASGSISDTDLLFGWIRYRLTGLGLVGLSYAVVLGSMWLALRKVSQKSRQLLLAFGAAALCSYAFFLFNTEMHERYLFPFVAFGLPLVFLRGDFAVLYVLGSLLLLFNLFGALPATFIDKAMYQAFPALDVFIASAQVCVFIAFCWKYCRWALEIPKKATMRLTRRSGAH